MPYLGNPPAEAYTTTVKDSFSGDGSTTAFTLSVPSTTNDLRVVVENVIQDPTVAYSVSGTTLTFTSAPPTGTNNIYAVNLGPAVQTVTPPAEIGNATTFNSSVTVQGAFTSPGIDDNATSTAMTLDSSGNLLVGTTDTSPVTNNTDGIVLKSNGQVQFSYTGTGVAVNRKGSDGNIFDLRKDSTTVGSIGATSGSTYYTTYASGVTGSGIIGGDGNVLLANKNGASTDGSVDLGASNKRVRNLYLSGGVYLGGTGADNYLDDYEEGTFTPALTDGGSPTYATRAGWYTKIGNTVNFIIQIVCNGGISGSSAVVVSGLPFTLGSNGSQYPPFTLFCERGFQGTTATQGYVGLGVPSTSAMEIYEQFNSSSLNYNNLTYNEVTTNEFYVRIAGMYRTS